MSYIILNGVNSNTIQGLIISTLPPITKPQIRTNVEVIDGRDGDITTYLGYSAYDKEIEIGLSWNYDVDEVIQYFNSSGVVTFSNEPDKYYNYEIIDQINFEKLIRFKTAKVTLHCQPFKYSLLEGTKTITTSGSTINNSGNIYSKPILTITGSGTVGISLNSVQIFSIDFENANVNSITIDTNLMEAYNGTTLENRNVTGDYDQFKLNIGTNTITWSGTVTSIVIENYSRWI